MNTIKIGTGTISTSDVAGASRIAAGLAERGVKNFSTQISSALTPSNGAVGVKSQNTELKQPEPINNFNNLQDTTENKTHWGVNQTNSNAANGLIAQLQALPTTVSQPVPIQAAHDTLRDYNSKRAWESQPTWETQSFSSTIDNSGSVRMTVSIDTIINNAINYTSEFVTQTEAALLDADLASRGFTWVVAKNFNWDYMLTKPVLKEDVPDFTDWFDAPANKAISPEFIPIYIPELPTIPDAPVLDTTGLFDINRPNSNVPAFQGTLPNVNVDKYLDEMNQLDKPVIQDIPVPTLTDINIRSMPTVNLPTFDVDMSITLPDVQDLETKYRNAYNEAHPAMKAFIDDGIRAWLDAYSPNHTENFALLEQKLAEGMRTGTALPEQYEIELRNSARREIDLNQAAQETAVLSDNEKRGFFTAPGAVAAGLKRVKQASGAALAAMNTEIFIKRKEQEIQHIQFCMQIEASLQQGLLQLMMSYANVLGDVNRTAMGYAQGITDAVAKTTELLFERARLQMSLYQLEIQLYEARLKAALAVLDEYRMEMEANKLIADIDMAKIEIWKEQWDIQLKEMDIYVKEIEAVLEKAQLVKFQLDVFNASVNSYNAILGAKKLEIDIYEAALRGDTAKLEGLLSELKVYQVEVETVKARNEIQIAHSQAISQNNKNLAEIYAVEVDGYKAEVTAESQRFGAAVQGYVAKLDAFKANNMFKIQSLEADIKVASFNLDALKTDFDASLAVQSKNADLFMNHVKIQTDAALGIGSHYSVMAAAGLSAQNTMVSEQTTV